MTVSNWNRTYEQAILISFQSFCFVQLTLIRGCLKRHCSTIYCADACYCVIIIDAVELVSYVQRKKGFNSTRKLLC